MSHINTGMLLNQIFMRRGLAKKNHEKKTALRKPDNICLLALKTSTMHRNTIRKTTLISVQ
jgi:hypothetical protein